MFQFLLALTAIYYFFKKKQKRLTPYLSIFREMSL